MEVAIIDRNAGVVEKVDAEDQVFELGVRNRHVAAASDHQAGRVLQRRHSGPIKHHVAHAYV